MSDVNITSIIVGDVQQAGMYLFYAMLAAVASVMGLWILLLVLAYLFHKSGIGDPLGIFK